MSAPVLNKVTGPRTDHITVEPSQALKLPSPPLGRLMLGAAVVASVLVHSVLLGTVLTAEPNPNPAEQVESVQVELVPEPATKPEKPEPEKPELKTPEPEKPKPEPEKKQTEQKPEQKPQPSVQMPDFSQMLAAQQAIQQQPKPVPLPSQTKPAKPQAASAGSEAPSAVSPDKPDDGPPPVTETSPQDALAAAARISDLMHLPELTSLGTFNAAPSTTKAKLTAAEIAAFRNELRRCWSAATDVPADQKPRATIRLALNRDGSIGAQPQLLSVSAPLHGASVVRNAMQAIAKCAPYHSLPASKYAEWKLLDLQFTARDVASVGAHAESKATN